MKEGHVEVWNNGPYDYQEEYQGDVIMIPRGKCIEMPRAKALHFLEQYRPFQRSGHPSQQGIKALTIKEDPEQHAAKRDQPFKFVASDGEKFRTKAGLAAHEEKLNFKPEIETPTGSKSRGKKQSA